MLVQRPTQQTLYFSTHHLFKSTQVQHHGHQAKSHLPPQDHCHSKHGKFEGPLTVSCSMADRRVCRGKQSQIPRDSVLATKRLYTAASKLEHHLQTSG